MAELDLAAERLALVFSQAGMQRTAARVWCTVLFAEQESITAGEVAEALGVSAGGVSGAINSLLGSGLIEPVAVPGSRRTHYRFPTGAWGRLMSQRNQLFGPMVSAAEEGIDTVGEESAAGKRLADMRDFYAYMAQELPALIERWDAMRSNEAESALPSAGQRGTAGTAGRRRRK
ncbi:GbsR/MarR family transcriptional regulator [Streptomyces sp. 900116325]